MSSSPVEPRCNIGIQKIDYMNRTIVFDSQINMVDQFGDSYGELTVKGYTYTLQVAMRYDVEEVVKRLRSFNNK